MPLDPTAITASFFAVLKSDAAGAAVRAALPGGAASVIPADDLKKTLPDEPFLALRPGPINGDRYQPRACFFTWWIYDAPARRFTRINQILPLIEAAYPRTAIAYGHTALVGISQELPEDRALARPTRSITFTYTTRR